MKKQEKVVFLKARGHLSSLGHTMTKLSLNMKINNQVKKDKHLSWNSQHLKSMFLFYSTNYFSPKSYFSGFIDYGKSTIT